MRQTIEDSTFKIKVMTNQVKKKEEGMTSKTLKDQDERNQARR